MQYFNTSIHMRQTLFIALLATFLPSKSWAAAPELALTGGLTSSVNFTAPMTASPITWEQVAHQPIIASYWADSTSHFAAVLGTIHAACFLTATVMSVKVRGMVSSIASTVDSPNPVQAAVLAFGEVMATIFATFYSRSITDFSVELDLKRNSGHPLLVYKNHATHGRDILNWRFTIDGGPWFDVKDISWFALEIANSGHHELGIEAIDSLGNRKHAWVNFLVPSPSSSDLI